MTFGSAHCQPITLEDCLRSSSCTPFHSPTLTPWPRFVSPRVPDTHFIICLFVSGCPRAWGPEAPPAPLTLACLQTTHLFHKLKLHDSSKFGLPIATICSIAGSLGTEACAAVRECTVQHGDNSHDVEVGGIIHESAERRTVQTLALLKQLPGLIKLTIWLDVGPDTELAEPVCYFLREVNRLFPGLRIELDFRLDASDDYPDGM